jgi:endonuclease/exonuclease/phosphatase family metal-dependent hydrolase
MLVSVLTYNCLAEAHIKPERYPGVDPRWLDSTIRYRRIADFLCHCNADIICLQEVDKRLLKLLADQLPSGKWGWIWSIPHVNRPDAIATFWKDPWIYDQPAVSRYRGVGQVPHFGGGGRLLFLKRDTDEPAGDLDTVGPAPSRPTAHLVVANAHLPWDAPNAPFEKRNGLSQAKMLEHELRPFSQPTIVAGDFNAMPESDTVRVFKDNGFQDAHPSSAFTTNFGNPAKLDYLLHRGLPRVHYDFLVPFRWDRLPNADHPSDHLPLSATFEL